MGECIEVSLPREAASPPPAKCGRPPVGARARVAAARWGEIGQVLSVAQGIRDRIAALRAAPSAGALGRQGAEEITFDELAEKVETVNDQVVIAISLRVARIPSGH